jgi:hypothetical protein
MKSKVILEVPLRVDTADFVHLDAPLTGLDEVVTDEAELKFTLLYPFEKPYAGTIQTGGGASRRQILEAIRAGFRTMYAGTTNEGGAYGRAHQELDHLFIDRVELDDGVLAIEVST